MYIIRSVFSQNLMKLPAPAFDLTENNISFLLIQKPVIPGNPLSDRGAYEKLCFRIKNFIIKAAPPRMIGLTADDGPLNVKTARVRDLTGVDGIFVSVGGLILPENG